MDRKLYDLQRVVALGAKRRCAPHQHPVHRLIEVIILANATFLLGPFLMAQRPARPARKLPTSATTLASGEQQPRYKAIWEPVNYTQDLNLHSVFFVTPDVGYVSGDHGTILKTTDGGKTWTVELGGDPQSREAHIYDLRFIDETHGWAIQMRGELLRTTDGEAWERVGHIGEHFNLKDYVFATENMGLLVGDNPNDIARTLDGGRTWEPVTVCAATIQVEGLTRNVVCELRSISFPSASIGYAVGGYGESLFTMKTEDAGKTWKLFYQEKVSDNFNLVGGGQLLFKDENTGIVTLRDGKILVTTDGGQNWRGVVGTAGEVRFADPEVGMAFQGSLFAYTTDGGLHWNSRQLRFPTEVSGFSFPRRDRAYVVGQHGMIYRYRVVPIEYQVANMIDAPIMPGYSLSIQPDVQRLRAQISELRTKLQAVEASQPAAPAGGGETTLAPTGGASSQDVSAGGVFTQDTLVGEGFTQSTSDTGGAGSTQDAGGVGGGFAQDTAPLAPAIQSCCAQEVQNVQSSMGSFTQNLSTVSTRYRSLNLILAGIRLFSDLVNKTQGMRTSFASVRQAKDAQTALAALTQFSTSLEDVARTASSGFQTSGGAPAAATPQQPQ